MNFVYIDFERGDKMLPVIVFYGKTMYQNRLLVKEK